MYHFQYFEKTYIYKKGIDKIIHIPEDTVHTVHIGNWVNTSTLTDMMQLLCIKC